MEKFVPFDKLSKKKQRQINAKRRNSWGNINPVTKKPERIQAYKRNKARQLKQYFEDVPFLCA